MKLDAQRIAEEVIGHIDTMYPDMWKAVSSNARRSLRGCIINTIRSHEEAQRAEGKAPPEHEWDKSGKCKWCPAQRTGG